MNLQDLRKKAIFLLVGLLCFSFFGCINFYQRNVQDAMTFQDEAFVGEEGWYQFIKSTAEIKPILNLFSDGLVYEANDYRFDGNDLMATLSLAPVANFTIPDKKNFRRGLIPEAERAGLLSTLTLAVKNPLKEGAVKINLADIANLTYFDKNEALTIITSSGITIGSIVVGGAIFLAIACNCPRVYALNPAGEKIPQGSLLSGAIFQSLEREDVLMLEHVQAQNGQIQLMVANELPEREYLDQLQLQSIKVPAGYQLAYGTGDAELLAFGEAIAPVAAEGALGQDILVQVRQTDEHTYNFGERTYQESLNEATFTFDKSQLKGQTGYLIMEGKQSTWLEEVAEYFFQQFGTDFDQWMGKMDEFPREKYDENAAKRGMSMTAYLETAAGWEKIGTYHNAGIVREKIMAMPVDLSKVQGQQVRIKLSSAFNFWEVNQLSLSTDLANLPAPQTHSLLSATNQDGEDVMELLQNRDQQYYLQPSEGDYIKLNFAVPQEAGLTYLLKGSGYYHHERSYTHAPQKKALRKMKFYGPLITHDLSLALHQLSMQSKALAVQQP
ncbi:MAG: hypothetical protein AAFR61_25540 [Bacteroidota bacterium]